MKINELTVGLAAVVVVRKAAVRGQTVRERKKKWYKKSRSTGLWWDLMENKFVYDRITEERLW